MSPYWKILKHQHLWNCTIQLFTEPQTFLSKLVDSREFWLPGPTLPLNCEGLSLFHLNISVWTSFVPSVCLGAVLECNPNAICEGEKKIFPPTCDKSPSVTNSSSHIWNSGLVSSGRPRGDTFLVMHKIRPNCHPGKAERRHTPRLHRLA